MEKRIGKRDILLLAVILLAALAFWGGFHLKNRGEGRKVQVTVDGKLYGIYDFEKNAQKIPITIDGEVTNTLVIQDHKADMTDADCPDQLCVHQKAVSAPGETIVCLPNKVVVEIVGDQDEAEFDTIAK